MLIKLSMVKEIEQYIAANFLKQKTNNVCVVAFETGVFYYMVNTGFSPYAWYCKQG